MWRGDRALPQRPLAFPRERAARRPRRVTGRGAGAGRGEAGGWRRDLRALLPISRVRPERDARGSGPGRSVRAREAGLAVRRSPARAWAPSAPPRPPGAMGLCCCRAWSGHLRAPKGNSRRTCAGARGSALRGAGAASSGCGRGSEPRLGGCLPFPGASRHLPRRGQGSGAAARPESPTWACASSSSPRSARRLGPWAGAREGAGRRGRGSARFTAGRRVPARPAGPPHGEPGQRLRRPCGLSRERAHFHSFSSPACHRLEPGPLAQFSKSHGRTCRGAACGARGWGGFSESSSRTGAGAA